MNVCRLCEVEREMDKVGVCVNYMKGGERGTE